jgi:hypothetical protein
VHLRNSGCCDATKIYLNRRLTRHSLSGCRALAQLGLEAYEGQMS